MSNLRRDFNRFMVRNRDKGIPNLMLYIGMISFALYLATFVGAVSGKTSVLTNLYGWLSFDADLILKGQVWRIFSYVFTFLNDNNGVSISGILFCLISIYFYTWLGRTLEMVWGRLKFNIYYFSGVLLLSLTALLLRICFPDVSYSGAVSAYYVNISLFIAVATIAPDQRVLLMMFIPIKMKWLAIVDLALMTLSVVGGMDTALTASVYYSPKVGLVYGLYALLPVVGLLNYLIFFGRDIGNLFGRRANHYAPPRPPKQPAANPGRTSTGRSAGQSYHHKCTVCGRTDVDCPDLEFRYCSKCKGYFCYCIDHINNHNHVQ